VLVANVASAEAFYDTSLSAEAGPAAETINGVVVRRVPVVGRISTRAAKLGLPGLATRELAGRSRRLQKAFRAELREFTPDVVMTLPHLFANVRGVFEVSRTERFRLVWIPLLHEEDPNWPFEEMRGAADHADAVIAMTTHEMERLRASYVSSPHRVTHCPPGVRITQEQPERPLQDEVLYLGRITPRKGVQLLVQAMTEVWHRRPHTRLILAGGTDEGERPAWIPFDSRIEVFTDVAAEVKDDLLRRAICLVLPSQIESFGLVVLEAWARSVPVVALDTPVMRSVIDHGVNGLLASPQPSELAASILKLLASPEEASSMGRHGKNRVRTDHTVEGMVSCIQDVYAGLA
jgi:glycosyltransferase involved in cell wall biosynthesis